MKPLISENERIQAVRNFIVARYQKHARINSYDAIVPFLREKRVRLLCELKASGQASIYDTLGHRTGSKSIFCEDDAERYFEWLVAVVIGTEDATEDLVKQANDQLFRFIHVMNEDIEQDKNVQLIAPYDWQALFLSFDERLTDIQRIIDKGDKDIAEVLKSLLEMVKKNIVLLNSLYKVNEKVFGKGN